MQTILMCAPEHFGVDYVINPWMTDNRGKTDRALALRQWNDLRDALAKHAQIALIEAQPGVPDLVFTANAGMVIGKVAAVSRFLAPERQGEEPFFRAWFKDNGFTVLPWPKNVYFEGAGDALLDRGQPIIWYGSGFRSGETASALLEKMFNRPVLGLQLVDPRFYHLDTCFCPLAGGYLMYYPPAFDEASQELIAETIEEDKRIVVDSADALAFACNAVDLDKHIFMNAASPDLQKELSKAGLTTVITPLSEFLKAGGASKCLTLKLTES